MVTKRNYPTPRRADAERGGRGDLLSDLKGYKSDHFRKWPTPSKSDATGGPGSSGREGGPNLRTAVKGSLNPDWVEWLMGWPVGWTALRPLGVIGYMDLLYHIWEADPAEYPHEPNRIPRLATGVEKRVARLKAIGNGQVPQTSREAFLQLLERSRRQ